MPHACVRMNACPHDKDSDRVAKQGVVLFLLLPWLCPDMVGVARSKVHRERHYALYNTCTEQQRQHRKVMYRTMAIMI